jgi:pimeloyl-ACP methyl ester carboxylesterase
MEATVNGTTLAYDDCGSGQPLLLIHGFPLCRRMWQPQLAEFAADRRVIVPDLRGFGDSRLGKGPVTMDTYADDLVALLDSMGIVRAVVAGMSMGGYVLFNLLERYPSRVSAAIFMVTKSGADDEAGKIKRTTLAEEAAKGNAKAVTNIFSDILFAEETLANHPELVAQVRSWLEASDPAALAAGLLAMRDRRDSTSLLAKVRVPALVIGAEKDRAIPVAASHLIADGIDGAHLEIIPGAGHMANLERPALVLSAMEQFLKGLPPAVK